MCLNTNKPLHTGHCYRVIVAITAMPTWTVGLDLLTATGLARVTATGMWYWNTNTYTILTTDVDPRDVDQHI